MLDPGQKIKRGGYIFGAGEEGKNPRGDVLQQAYVLKLFNKAYKNWTPPKKRKPFI